MVALRTPQHTLRLVARRHEAAQVRQAADVVRYTYAIPASVVGQYDTGRELYDALMSMNVDERRGINPRLVERS